MVKEVRVSREGGHVWDLPGYREVFDEEDLDEVVPHALPKRRGKRGASVRGKEGEGFTNPDPRQVGPGEKRGGWKLDGRESV